MNPRNSEIDIVKGILTIGMVFGHTVQFLHDGSSLILNIASILANLVSFSGFLGCFGFACWMAYLQKDVIPWKKVILTALKPYLAFIISGSLFICLVSDSRLNAGGFLKVLALRDIPGYSEFLIAFALFTILSCVFASPLRFVVAERSRVGIFAAFVLVLAELLPEGIVYDPYLGLFLGGSGVSGFPILLYSPVFVLGAWIARSRHPYNFLAMLVAVAGVAVFLVLLLMKIPVRRFPPGAAWIVGSCSMAYLYYGVSRLVAARFPRWIKVYLNSIGQNVLFYLLLTNLALFVCAAVGWRHSSAAFETVAAYCVLMGAVYFLQFISVDLKRADSTLPPTT